MRLCFMQEFSKELLKRLKLIQDLQKRIHNIFIGKDYNIFIFGSFLTESYKPGKSDIDIAIYCPSVSEYIDIADYILDYFKQYSIKVDIFYIDLNTVAPVYCAPLESAIKFTTYYPDELKDFYKKCKKEYDRCIKEVKI